MRREAHYHGPARGFSLIEVLVAFVIMALALGVLFQIFGTGLRTTDTADHYVQAAVLAQTRLALAADQPPLRPGRESGAVAGTEFRWEHEIVSEDLPEWGMPELSGLELYRVSVRISWPAGVRDRELVLNTLRLQRAPR